MSDLRALIESGLVDKEDGTIFDTTTNLFWQKESSNKVFIWMRAKMYCESLTLAGYNDWRLPTREELEYLINRKYCPTIDPIFECKSDIYCSSSTDENFPNTIGCINFGDGFVAYGYKKDSIFVRAVRG